jgi:ATP-binding cassette subfamily C protein CydC
MARRAAAALALLPALRAMLAGSSRRMALGAALAALTVPTGMGLLGLSGWFIAATAIAGLQVASALVFDVFAPSAGIRLLALGRTATRYGERLITHDATLAALAHLRERLFRGWAGAGNIRDLLRRPARALFRLTSDLDALESLYLRLLVPASAALGAAILGTVVLGAMAPWLGIALGAWMLAVGAAVAAGLLLRSRLPAVRRALITERLRAQAVDLVSGQTELVMAGRLASHRDALQRTDRRLARADRHLHRLDVAAGAIYGVAGSLTLALVLLGVGVLVDQGRLGTAGATLALLIALSAMEPFAALRRGALEAGRTWLAARRLSPYCGMFQQAQQASLPAEAPEPGYAISLRQVSARYPDSPVDALQSFSLTLAPGERVAVVGPSGAGKSTLMALAAGELAPRQGTIRTLPYAWLSQRTDLFQDSLRDNLLLADADADDDALWRALGSAGLASEVRALHAGLDTRLGEGGLGLSGGQARRLALARLLLQPHPLWLLDEPTEGLDAITAADVLARLHALGTGRAWLMATHLRREAALADRLLVLRGGRIDAEFPRGSAGFETTLAALRPD